MKLPLFLFSVRNSRVHGPYFLGAVAYLRHIYQQLFVTNSLILFRYFYLSQSYYTYSTRVWIYKTKVCALYYYYPLDFLNRSPDLANDFLDAKADLGSAAGSLRRNFKTFYPLCSFYLELWPRNREEKAIRIKMNALRKSRCKRIRMEENVKEKAWQCCRWVIELSKKERKNDLSCTIKR